jgi:hypothetical protein
MRRGHGELTGDQGGGPAVAVLEDIQEADTRGGVEGFEDEVVDDQELSTGDPAQFSGVAAVGLG